MRFIVFIMLMLVLSSCKPYYSDNVVWFEDNLFVDDCLSACWNHLNVASTSNEQLFEFLNSERVSLREYTTDIARLSALEGTNNIYSVRILINDDKLYSMGVSLKRDIHIYVHSNTQMNDLIDILGNPPYIRSYVEDNQFQGDRFIATVEMFYPASGFMFRFENISVDKDGDAFSICPSPEQSITDIYVFEETSIEQAIYMIELTKTSAYLEPSSLYVESIMSELTSWNSFECIIVK